MVVNVNEDTTENFGMFDFLKLIFKTDNKIKICCNNSNEKNIL